MDGEKPAQLLDWQGRPHDPANGPAAHPNSRFTVAAAQCPSYSRVADAPQGVPISAIIFGGRRSTVAPLVFEALDWAHGVFAGAAVASETTAAAVGAVGQVRRDPMAMKPFCGYNFADYWAHWLSFAGRSARLPKIFHVNWFRKDADGRFMWPGYGENMRVLKWVVDRCEGLAHAHATPVGLLPDADDLDLRGLALPRATLEALLAVDPAVWQREVGEIAGYFEGFGERLPAELGAQVERIRRELARQQAA
jgi:phosphoenolpyruvate carboxykinase (GTP)